MPKTAVAFFLIFLYTLPSFAEAAPSAPDPAPYRDAKVLDRRTPELKLSRFEWEMPHIGMQEFEQAEFVTGNKSVSVRKSEGEYSPWIDHTIQIYADGNEIGRLSWWGAFRTENLYHFGYPFKPIPKQPQSLVVDRIGQRIIFRKPYLTPQSEVRTFQWILRAAGPNLLTAEWDLDVTHDELVNMPIPYNISIWLKMGDLSRCKKIRIEPDGPYMKNETVFRLLHKKSTWRGHRILEYRPDEPGKGYKISFGEVFSFAHEIAERHKNQLRYAFEYLTYPLTPMEKGIVLIDLMDSEFPPDIPAPKGGALHWKTDNQRNTVPPVRNEMPNPGFLQNMRFWEKPRTPVSFRLIPGKEFVWGRTILELDAPSGANHSGELRSFPLQLEPDKKYTFSFYMKAAAPDKHGPAGLTLRTGENAKPEFFFANSDWHRYSTTFQPASPNARIILSGWNSKLHIAGLQMEQSAQPTAWIAPPLESRMLNLPRIFLAPEDDRIPLELEFTGEPAMQGEIDLRIRNIYGEEVCRATEDVMTEDDGRTVLKQSIPRTLTGYGVFVLETTVKTPGVPAYSNFFRFTVTDEPADGATHHGLLADNTAKDSSVWKRYAVSDHPSPLPDQPGYDIGNQEKIQAWTFARTWIARAAAGQEPLRRTLFGLNRLTFGLEEIPFALCAVSEGIGRMLSGTRFYASANPSTTGISAMVFKRRNEAGIAAVWVSDRAVDLGYRKGPEIILKPEEPLTAVQDVMGNPRSATPGKDGTIRLPLTAAPLFLSMNNAGALADALRRATTDSPAAAISVVPFPTQTGAIGIRVTNHTADPQKGSIETKGRVTEYDLKPLEETIVRVPDARTPNAEGFIYHWETPFTLFPQNGRPAPGSFDLRHFYIPEVKTKPNWNKLHGIPCQWTHPKSSARVKAAWDTRYLYLHIVADDNSFAAAPPNKKPFRALNIRIDSRADARGNLFRGLNADDILIRTEYGEKPAGGIRADWIPTKTGYDCTILIPQKELLPFKLEFRNVTGIQFDADDGTPRAVCGRRHGETAEPAGECADRPDTWLLMFLTEYE